MSVETAWEIPEPISVCEVRLDDESITTVRQHGNPSGPRLVLSHGNGLAIDLYYPFWSLLADDFELMVYDLRNHGWNPVGPRREHNIPTLIHDHDLDPREHRPALRRQADRRGLPLPVDARDDPRGYPPVLGAGPVRPAAVQAHRERDRVR